MTSRVSSPRARQKERNLLLPAGEGAGPLRPPFPENGKEAEQRLVATERTRVVREGEVLRDGELVEDDGLLWRIPQPEMPAAVAGNRVEVPATERHATRPDRELPGDELDERRLPDPVPTG